MANWKKVEQVAESQTGTKMEKDAATEVKPDKKAEKAQRRAEKEKIKREKLIEYGKKVRQQESARNARYGRSGARRGRYKWAAPIGFFMSLLAIIGVVAILSTAVTMVKELTDDTALREEIYYFLQPLTTYNPIPDFLDVNEEDIDELLRAAVWRITEAERVRMLQEKDDNTKYSLDNNGRLIVPLEQIEESYRYLFGEEAVLKHRTLGEDDVEYSEGNKCYYIPFNFVTSLHQPVIDTVRHQGGEYYVRMSFVSANDLKVDEHGNTIPPTPDMEDFSQIYVLKRVDGKFTVTAVVSEVEQQK